MSSRFTTLLIWNLLWLYPIGITAQMLSVDNHVPCSTDSLLVYKLPYVPVGESGDGCIWNFTNASIEEADVIPMNFFAIQDNDMIQTGLHREHSNYYMSFVSDTLWQLGYETSKFRMHYSSPMPLLRFPFAYGDSLTGVISGRGQYCHSIPLSLEGKTTVQVDGVGRLVIPDMTIDSVLRVHSVSRYAQMSYTSTDVTEDKYQWYSDYCRYPIWETVIVRAVTQSDTVYTSSSYYNPTEIDKIPEHKPMSIDEKNEEADSLITHVSFLPNPVMTDLQVNYTLARVADVYVSVHYDGGISTYRTSLSREQEGTHTVFVNMSGMPTGNYVVYVHANDVVVSGDIIKL